MALSDKVDSLIEEKKQLSSVLEARAKLQNIKMMISQTNSELAGIATSGSFNTVDAEIKTALVAGWDIVKAADAAFAGLTDLLE